MNLNDMRTAIPDSRASDLQLRFLDDLLGDMQVVRDAAGSQGAHQIGYLTAVRALEDVFCGRVERRLTELDGGA